MIFQLSAVLSAIIKNGLIFAIIKIRLIFIKFASNFKLFTFMTWKCFLKYLYHRYTGQFPGNMIAYKINNSY